MSAEILGIAVYGTARGRDGKSNTLRLIHCRDSTPSALLKLQIEFDAEINGSSVPLCAELAWVVREVAGTMTDGLKCPPWVE